jgi:hypothetical protein
MGRPIGAIGRPMPPATGPIGAPIGGIGRGATPIGMGGRMGIGIGTGIARGCRMMT